jgi:alkylation response protein AidB-like acyl-CoA dehydrogenase
MSCEPVSHGSDHEAFRESFRAFVERDVRPLAGQIAVSGTVPDKVFAIAGDNGFLGTGVPEEHGGAGTGDIRFALLAAEEFARAGLPGVGLAFALHAAVAVPLLTARGTAALQARWLPAMAAGDVLAAVAVGPAADTGRTVRLTFGEDGAVLDGTLEPVLNVTRARLFVVPVQTADGRTHVVLVSADAPGVVTRLAEDALGLPGADAGHVEFHAVPVPGDAFLASDAILPGSTVDAGQEALAGVRLVMAVIAVAGARRALAGTLDYVRGRRAFGRPVASFQNTKHVLAGIAADLSVAETYLAVCLADLPAGRPDPLRAAAASLRGTELFTAAADQGLQLHGGYGYMREYPIAQAYADAEYLRLLADGAAARETLAAGLGLDDAQVPR